VSFSYQSTEGLNVELSDGVLSFTIDRPERKNAIDDDMVALLIASLESANQDEAVRVIVLRGAGSDFCAGFDILSRNARSEAKPRIGSIQRRLPSETHRLIPLICSIQVPVVCAVQGWAAGIGLHLVLAADFAIVTEDARLWEPFMKRGFSPDSGGTWLLPRRVGEVRAREILVLGRSLTGIEAAEWQMVHRAVPAAELDGAVNGLVEELVKGPTVAIGLTKWLMHAGTSQDLVSQLANEGYAMELSSRSEDFREGIAAFAEKRSPNFKGR
jgi:2-(1,2-epoxy-1,2-dihydrophenyl)acetyl-CoA isomerase